jgi:predicted DsbA family dithiol-disulfide isomerase
MLQPMIAIDIVSDTVCPWCFIGKRRLERAMAERPDFRFQIGWRPFQLNPDMPRAGMDRQQYLALKFGGRERAFKIYDHVGKAGEGEGVAFAFDAIHRQPNTFDSHRLIRWSARAGLQDAVVETLFRRYFEQGVDIGDRAILSAIAAEAGMDGAEVGDWLEREVDSELVREEEAIARRMGIGGVPCFIVDRRFAVSGAQEPSVLVNVFDLAMKEKAAGQAAE